MGGITVTPRDAVHRELRDARVDHIAPGKKRAAGVQSPRRSCPNKGLSPKLGLYPKEGLPPKRRGLYPKEDLSRS